VAFLTKNRAKKKWGFLPLYNEETQKENTMIIATLIALTYFYLLYVLVLTLYETYRSDRP
jgi:hypothetical protein